MAGIQLIALLLAFVAAVIVTGLFAYGAWLLLRAPDRARARIIELARSLHLIRADENPIITPGGAHWEAQGVLNPAAALDGDNVHLFYRAIGADGVSRIGYATSKDGSQFTRLPYPVFALAGESPDTGAMRAKTMSDHSALVASGGSWGGVEDPRAVILDDRLYLTFSAFSNWDSLRMGLTTLALEDLRARRWKWTPPVYLSPRGQVHKNWVLFPEKVNGKFAVLHSLHGGSHDNVRVEYFDSLDQEPAAAFHSPDPNALPDNPHEWHKRVRGAGPPPIKTPHGWLVLYHAIARSGPSHYKLGAMLLDLKDPTKVIGRSKAPVLEPDAQYENEGAKAGVVYACGAIARNDALTVYYGGADSVICVARHSLSKLLSHLVPSSNRTAAPFFSEPAVMTA